MELSGAPNDVERLIRGFLGGTLTAEQLSTGLLDDAHRPDLGPRAFTSVNIDWQQVPQERLFAFAEVSASITGPVLENFFKGQIPVDKAADQLAPFFLMWAGFGFDPPADASPAWLERREQLVQKIVDLGRQT